MHDKVRYNLIFLCILIVSLIYLFRAFLQASHLMCNYKEKQQDNISKIRVPKDIELFYVNNAYNAEGGAYYSSFHEFLLYEFNSNFNSLTDDYGIDSLTLNFVKQAFDLLDLNQNFESIMKSSKYPEDCVATILARLPTYRNNVCVFYSYLNLSEKFTDTDYKYIYMSYSPGIPMRGSANFSFDVTSLEKHIDLAAVNKFINIAVCGNHTSILVNPFRSIEKLNGETSFTWSAKREKQLLNKSIDNFWSRINDHYLKSGIHFDVENLQELFFEIEKKQKNFFTLPYNA